MILLSQKGPQKLLVNEEALRLTRQEEGKKRIFALAHPHH